MSPSYVVFFLFESKGLGECKGPLTHAFLSQQTSASFKIFKKRQYISDAIIEKQDGKAFKSDFL